ncbi:MAG: hypothetical protein B7C24_18035 [Bacteroidetes bacterium 4572_77]|nr:MAG: hypothetical protein B7C24_18035 [Bacteroidetes bacterium 4572_77]
MYKINALLLILTFLSVKCSKEVEEINHSIINTQHLQHLYQEIEIDNHKMGTVWIYCNAPEYQVLTDDDEGYTCVDDVARTLVFFCRQYQNSPSEYNLTKIKSFSQFILYMKADNGYYYNFLFPNNQINTTHQNSKPIPSFWSWRAYWALSEMCLIDQPELEQVQQEAQEQLNSLTQKINILFQNPAVQIEVEGFAMSKWMEDYGSDQLSVILLGLSNYYKLNPQPAVKELAENLGDAIISVQQGNTEVFPHYAFLSWKNIWHAWGSAQSYALLKAGNELNIPRFISSALNEIDNYYIHYQQENYFQEFSLRMLNDSIQIYDFNKFPQIAYGISPMILASMEAYHITNSEKYAVQAGQLGAWFYGKNPANQVMYSSATGRAYDGINNENSVNYNSGAESTIALFKNNDGS